MVRHALIALLMAAALLACARMGTMDYQDRVTALTPSTTAEAVDG